MGAADCYYSQSGFIVWTLQSSLVYAICNTCTQLIHHSATVTGFTTIIYMHVLSARMLDACQVDN